MTSDPRRRREPGSSGTPFQSGCRRVAAPSSADPLVLWGGQFLSPSKSPPAAPAPPVSVSNWLSYEPPLCVLPLGSLPTSQPISKLLPEMAYYAFGGRLRLLSEVEVCVLSAALWFQSQKQHSAAAAAASGVCASDRFLVSYAITPASLLPSAGAKLPGQAADP